MNMQARLVCISGLRSCPTPNSKSESTLTLGTDCILAAGGYVDGKQPSEERGARRDSVVVRVVVCIVRALRERREVYREVTGVVGVERRCCCRRVLAVGLETCTPDWKSWRWNGPACRLPFPMHWNTRCRPVQVWTQQAASMGPVRCRGVRRLGRVGGGCGRRCCGQQERASHWQSTTTTTATVAGGGWSVVAAGCNWAGIGLRRDGMTALAHGFSV